MAANEKVIVGVVTLVLMNVPLLEYVVLEKVMFFLLIGIMAIPHLGMLLLSRLMVLMMSVGLAHLSKSCCCLGEMQGFPI